MTVKRFIEHPCLIFFSLPTLFSVPSYICFDASLYHMYIKFDASERKSTVLKVLIFTIDRRNNLSNCFETWRWDVQLL